MASLRIALSGYGACPPADDNRKTEQFNAKLRPEEREKRRREDERIRDTATLSNQQVESVFDLWILKSTRALLLDSGREALHSLPTKISRTPWRERKKTDG